MLYPTRCLKPNGSRRHSNHPGTLVLSSPGNAKVVRAKVRVVGLEVRLATKKRIEFRPDPLSIGGLGSFISIVRRHHQSHKIGNGADTKFFHAVRAMTLDRLFTEIEAVCDYFVCMASNDHAQDFVLTTRQV